MATPQERRAILAEWFQRLGIPFEHEGLPIVPYFQRHYTNLTAKRLAIGTTRMHIEGTHGWETIHQAVDRVRADPSSLDDVEFVRQITQLYDEEFQALHQIQQNYFNEFIAVIREFIPMLCQNVETPGIYNLRNQTIETIEILDSTLGYLEGAKRIADRGRYSQYQ